MQANSDNKTTVFSFRMYFILVSIYLRGLFSSNTTILIDIYRLLLDNPNSECNNELLASGRAYFISQISNKSKDEAERIIKAMERSSIRLKRLESIWGVFWWLLLPIFYLILLWFRVDIQPLKQSYYLTGLKLTFVFGITFICFILTIIIQDIFYRPFSKMLSRMLTIPGVLEFYSPSEHKLLKEQK